jgi:hypothetical protein
MFPHPETIYTVRDMERRQMLDRIAQERAVRIATAEVTDQTGRGGPRWRLALHRIVLRQVDRLPLNWFREPAASEADTAGQFGSA